MDSLIAWAQAYGVNTVGGLAHKANKIWPPPVSIRGVLALLGRPVTPLSSYTWGTNTESVCCLGFDGDVHAILRTAGTNWQAPVDLTQAAHASTEPDFPNPPNAQSLAGYSFVALDAHGQPIEDTAHVIYLGSDGNIHDSYASGNTPSPIWTDQPLPAPQPPLGALPLTGSVPTTPLGAYPFVVYNPDGSSVETTKHVIYLDQKGALHELSSSPGNNWTDAELPTGTAPLLTQELSTPIAAYSFVDYYAGIAKESTEHVIYIDKENRLHELVKPAGGGSWGDNVLPGSPLVTNNLITPIRAYTFFVMDNDDNLSEISEHIIYIGSDSQLHEIYNIRQPYQTGWTPAVLPTKVPPFVNPTLTTPLTGFSLFSAIIETLTGGAGGDSTHYDVQECSEHVFYIASDGNLRWLYNVRPGGPGWIDGGAVPTVAIPLIHPASLFGGPPAKMTSLTGHSFVVHDQNGELVESELHVFYIDSSRNLHVMSVVRPGSLWADTNLTSTLGINPAA
jgi:hypothetical protein